MKKTQKTAFGLLGLGLVLATTFCAAQLPSPGASAVTSVTDIIQVRVVGSEPFIDITGINAGDKIIYPNQEIVLDYGNIKTLWVDLAYTNKDKEKRIVPKIYEPEEDPDYNMGHGEFSLNLDKYGYGKYVITAKGHNDVSGLDAEQEIDFEYLPIVASITQDGTNDPEITLDYNEDGPVSSAVIEVLDANSEVKLTKNLDKMTKEELELIFSDEGLISGHYTIRVTTKNNGGDILYLPFEIPFYYTAPESPNVPYAGALFNRLNISRTDYLLTGLIIFFAFASVAIMFIMKNHTKKSRKAHAKRRR